MKLKFQEIVFAKVELWLVLLLVLFGLFGLIFFAWFLRHSLEDPNASQASRVVVNLSKLPDQALALYTSGLEFNAEGELVQRDPRNAPFEAESSFMQMDPGFEENGYLLISSYDDEFKNSRVYLYDLQARKKIWEWVPDIDAIYAKAPRLADRFAGLPTQRFDPTHPYLLPDGRVLFIWFHAGVLVMVNPDGSVAWVRDNDYHHSIERDADGNFLVPYHISYQDGVYQDEGYAVITPDGQVLKEESITKLLERHGYGALLHAVGPWETDMIHLNDIQPMLESDDHVQKGDLAISCRNISTVFLYRPSEDRIVWLQTGPWYNQHDVDYLGNGRFSIFNNNVLRKKKYTAAGPSNILVYDTKSGETEAIHGPVFEKHQLFTDTQGVHRHLRNGDLFVEMSDAHQMFRIGPDGPRWRYVNKLKEPGRVGAVFWTRYFHRDELDLGWMDKAKLPVSDK